MGFGSNNCPELIALGHDMEMQVRIDGIYRTVINEEGEMTTLKFSTMMIQPSFVPFMRGAWDGGKNNRISLWWIGLAVPSRMLVSRSSSLSPRFRMGRNTIFSNDEYLRRSLASGEKLEKRKVNSLGVLLDLVRNVFGLEIESDDRLSRFLW